MNLNQITRRLANLDHHKNQENDLESALAQGLVQGSFSALISDEKVPLSATEAFFLAEAKTKNLVQAKEIAALAANYGIEAGRLEDVRSLGVIDWLDQAESERLIAATRDNLLGGKTLNDLQKRGWITIFSSNEKAFLHEVKKREICTNDDLLIGVLRTQHGIDKQKWQNWLGSGTVSILTPEEKTWLRAVQEGHNLQTLDQLKQDLGLKTTWHLKDRIQMQPDGQRLIDYKPSLKNLEYAVDVRPKINWYSRSENFGRCQISPELASSDLELYTKAKTPSDLSFWQRTRLNHLKQFKRDTAAFDQKLWQLLSPTERADLIAHSAHDLSPHRLKRREELQKLFSDTNKPAYAASLIENNEYFFLAAARREAKADLSTLATQYKCNLEDLKARGYIDYLTPDEQRLLADIQHNPNRTMFADQEAVQSLKQRQFYMEPTQPESTFLKHLALKNITSSDELRKSAAQFLISPEQLLSLKKRGFVDFLEDNERTYLQQFALNPKNKNLPDIAKSLGLDQAWQLKNRLVKENGQTIILDKVFLNPEPKCRFNAQVKYQEDRSLLTFRIVRKSAPVLRISTEDTQVYLYADKGLADLKYKDAERAIELKASGLKLHDLPILTNSDIEFLRKISRRKCDYETLKKVAQEDFAITNSRLDWLHQTGFFSIAGGRVTTSKEEAKELSDARIWLNTSTIDAKWARDILATLEIKRPSSTIENALKDKIRPIDLGHKLGDYALHFKLIRNEPLSDGEQLRLSSLRQNGIHPESPQFQRWLKEEPSSWRMKEARKIAYLDHYEKVYSVNKPVLKFVNKFKQVTHAQLNQLGLDDSEIARYTHGIAGHHRLLEHHVLPTPIGPISYYSIAHEGPISGRAFLEQDTAKKDIAERPQQRKDLLFHDLKVVDSVLAVIDERKTQGWVVKEIRNESAQYALTKAGVANNKRQDGPAFMDAVVVFEEVQTQGGGGSGKTETVAIEYGNYDLGRMKSKLSNCQFDQAVVFSRKDFTDRYQRHISIPNISFRSI